MTPNVLAHLRQVSGAAVAYASCVTDTQAAGAAICYLVCGFKFAHISVLCFQEAVLRPAPYSRIYPVYLV